MRIASLALIAPVALLGLSACNTLRRQPAPPPPVEVQLEPFDGCTPISALTRVVIPEKTETRIAITEVENPPYEPIQRKEEITRVVEPERTIFVDSAGREVTDICDTEINPSGMANGGERSTMWGGHLPGPAIQRVVVALNALRQRVVP